MKNWIYIILLTCTISGYAQDEILDAARIGNITLAETLKEKDEGILEFKSDLGYTPMILAAYYDQTKFMSFLMKNHVELHEVEGEGTALQAASYKGFNEAVYLLLEYGARTNIGDANGTTALIYAVQFNHSEIVRMLIERGADLHKKDPNGLSAKDYALQLKNDEILNILNEE